MSVCPKFGALVSCIPRGMIGGAATVLYGLIAVLGVRLWIEHAVDLTRASRMLAVGTCIIVGAANYTVELGSVRIEGIGLGCILAIFLYHFGEAVTSLFRLLRTVKAEQATADDVGRVGTSLDESNSSPSARQLDDGPPMPSAPPSPAREEEMTGQLAESSPA